jgi:hypothetical protein
MHRLKSQLKSKRVNSSTFEINVGNNILRDNIEIELKR